MRKKRKEFSVLKWIIFPLNSVVLAGIIAYFNVTVFGLQDGLPYSAIVVLIGVFSILINRYTESENRNLAKAAFIFEIVLTAALIINACYSVSVQRKMSVARMAENSQAATIGEISKLRGSRTQREALQKVDKPVAAQSVFADVENILFWIMCGELGLYGLSAFTLFAIAKLVDEGEPAETEEEFPTALDVSSRTRARRPELIAKTTTQSDTVSRQNADEQKTTQDDTAALREGLKVLRETLRLIAFHTPGVHYKCDLKPDCVWIRQMVSDAGIQRTSHGAKAKHTILRSALRMDSERFRAQVEAWLEDHGFFEDREEN